MLFGEKIEAIWRIDCASVIASLYSKLQDYASAEDVAQEVFIAAWKQWPEEGIPDNPRHWLLKVAHYKALDFIRRKQVRKRFTESESQNPMQREGSDCDSFTCDADEMLSLLFMACHPKLPYEQQSALILSSFFGLTSKVIARLFFTTNDVVKKRIQRAKEMLSTLEAITPLSAKKRIDSQISAVNDTLYLMFKQGYAPIEGQDWHNRELAEFAIRMTRILVGIVKQNADTLGLLALMEFQYSRFRARYGEDGIPVLFEDQDRTLWDHTLIYHAQGLIHRMLEKLSKADQTPSPIILQALIAQCYSVAPRYSSIDWKKLDYYYQVLLQLAYSPVVHLNYTVVISELKGADIALSELETLANLPKMQTYHYFHATKAEFLNKLGRMDEATDSLTNAIALVTNKAEKRLLENKLCQLTNSQKRHKGNK